MIDDESICGIGDNYCSGYGDDDSYRHEYVLPESVGAGYGDGSRSGIEHGCGNGDLGCWGYGYGFWDFGGNCVDGQSESDGCGFGYGSGCGDVDNYGG